jgi:bacillithiol system protein YtxJ
MNWNALTDEKQLAAIKDESNTQPILIFKHSTTCSISRATLDRLERNWKEEEMATLKPYFLDLLSYRSVSNQVAEVFAIEHQSPQVLIIANGKAIYNNSHFGIEYKNLKAFAKN